MVFGFAARCLAPGRFFPEAGEKPDSIPILVFPESVRPSPFLAIARITNILHRDRMMGTRYPAYILTEVETALGLSQNAI
jgi:hypothetical protein